MNDEKSTVVADLRTTKLRSLLALLDHDGCWGCVPGTAQSEGKAHGHLMPDRALAMMVAAQAAHAELRAVLAAVIPVSPGFNHLSGDDAPTDSPSEP
jgi:hypothetical protein